jgi:hypothetical protein
MGVTALPQFVLESLDYMQRTQDDIPGATK